MPEVLLREKDPLPLDGWVFVFLGAQTLLGHLHADDQGAYLEPVYVYRVGEEYKVNAQGERVEMRSTRELRPLLGFPEIRRLDLDTRAGVGMEQLLPETRTALAGLVEQYEEKLRQRVGGLVRGIQ